MTPRTAQITGLLLAVAAHAAVLAPHWWSPQTLAGGAGGPLNNGDSVELTLTETPRPEPEPEPEPEPQQEPKPEPEPEAIRTEKEQPQEREEPEKEEVVEEREPEDTTEEIRPEPLLAQEPTGDGRKAAPGAHDQGDHDDAWNRYLGELQRAIERHKTYPRQARLRRQEGVVRVSFRLDEEGRVAAVEVEQSSGSSLLDRHVEHLLSRIALPRPPSDVQVARQEITLPVEFRLN